MNIWKAGIRIQNSGVRIQHEESPLNHFASAAIAAVIIVYEVKKRDDIRPRALPLRGGITECGT